MQSFKSGYKYLVIATVILLGLGSVSYYITKIISVDAKIEIKLEVK